MITRRIRDNRIADTNEEIVVSKKDSSCNERGRWLILKNRVILNLWKGYPGKVNLPKPEAPVRLVDKHDY